jgi:hypothetical protein
MSSSVSSSVTRTPLAMASTSASIFSGGIGGRNAALRDGLPDLLYKP